MASNDSLDELFDLPEIQKEADTALSIVKKWVVDMNNATKDVKISIGGLSSDNSLVELADNTKKVTEAVGKQKKTTDELTLSLKEYSKLTDQIAVLQARNNALTSDNAKVVSQLKLEQQARNKELKLEAELQNTVNGSIEQARALVKTLTAERNKLNLSTDEGKARLTELNNEIDQHNAFIKANVDAYTQQKINIGNYSGALKVLEGELSKVRQKIDDHTQSGGQNIEMLQQLQKEEQLLGQLVDNQVNGFASATSELKNNERALQQLAAAGLQSTEFYQQLLSETAELRDNVGDLRNEIRNLASDTSTIDGLVEGAQLLAGAYGLASGGAELLGVSTEQVEEAQKKMQAILVVLNSLQAIQNGLQSDSSLMLLLRSARTKALVAIETIRNFVMKGTIASEAQATAASAAHTTATVAQTAATTAGTIALRLFRIALIGTGIGAILVLLSSAAYAMGAFGDETEDATSSMDDFNATLTEFKGNMEGANQWLDNFYKQRSLKAKLAGKSEKELNDIELDGMRAKQDQAKYELKFFDDKLKAATKSAKQLKELDSDERKEYDKAQKDAAKERESLVQKIANIEDDIETKKLEFQVQAKEKAEEAKKKLDDKAKQDREKRSADEKKIAEREFKAQIELSNKLSDRRADEFKRVSEDETVSLDLRLMALNKHYEEKETQIRANADAESLIGEKTATELKVIEEKKQQDINNLARVKGREYVDIIKGIADRERQYRIDSLDSIDANEDVAYFGELDKLEKQLINKEITVEEFEKRREALEQDFAKRRLDAQISYLEDEISIIRAQGGNVTEFEKILSNIRFKRRQIEVDSVKTTEQLKRDEIEKTYQMAATYASAAADVANLYADIQNAKIAERSALLDQQISDIDRNKNAEIEAINQTASSAEDKQLRIQEAEARAEQKRQEIENQKVADQQRAAGFEKSLAVTKALLSMFLGIAKEVETKGIAGLYSSTAITAAMSGIMGAIGAIAIPAYKEGTGEGGHPGGLAMLGDGFEKELVQLPSGQSFFSASVPTLYDLPKGTEVTPMSHMIAAGQGFLTPGLIGSMMQQKGSDMSQTNQLLGQLVNNSKNQTVHHWGVRNGEFVQVIKKGNSKFTYNSANNC